METDLGVVDLYEKNNKTVEEFSNTVDSSLRVKTNYEKVVRDIDWIDMIDEAIPYIDNILRNPNRFIVNEEDIVKIEQAKKITVESIKHLSRNTNLIQDIDKKTGDVTPSKILNINKEESYNTYENRVIYTLIQNMKYFIIKKKQILQQQNLGENKNDKKIEYTGNCKMLKENVNISIMLNTSLNDEYQNKEDIEEIMERIKELERKILALTGSEVYKVIDKLHIALITSPIKKTNMILKNVNFQYAMQLWNYLNDFLEDQTQDIKDNKDYIDQGELKKFVDENFLLNYLVVNTLDKDYEDNLSEQEAEDRQKAKDKLTEQLLDQLVNLNPNLSKENLQDMVGEKYTAIKYKNMATIAGIQEIFKKHINKYIEKING
ncbi:MAG: DUF2357 domain-containing protein [Oscillospiraceae bacterium]|nr:DUF2357 domain-containing protein [Oscillospiraceae bacterium]